MEKKLTYKNEISCVVLDVKRLEGYGTTIDVILTNGELKEKDKIVVMGLNGPINTKIKSLLTPHELKEMRVANKFNHSKYLKAAIGCKINALNLEDALAGSALYI